jgi:hypothetical protein
MDTNDDLCEPLRLEDIANLDRIEHHIAALETARLSAHPESHTYQSLSRNIRNLRKLVTAMREYRYATTG